MSPLKYFVSSANNESAAHVDHETFLPAHVVDSFFLGGHPNSNHEWVVLTDITGALRAAPADFRNTFPPSIQAELAYNEVANGVFGRVLEVEEFFLFDVQVLEQPADIPGPNDPVYLYGILYGPYSNLENTPAQAVKGQLTVTRADVLDGLAQEAPQAFRYANPADPGKPTSRFFHMMLPGDRQEELQRGRGIVLAYPLLPAELALSGASNETVVNQLLYDILSALKEDLTREAIKNPVCSMTLPVPSRSNLEHQLEFEGYTINGDTAIRKMAAKKGFQGLLASVFGTLTQERLNLPPQGSVDDFLKIVRDALNTWPGWPSPRALALRERVKPPAVGRRSSPESSPLPLPHQVSLPQPSSPLRPTAPTRVRLPPMSEAEESPTWMQDFIDAHQKPGASPSRLTRLRPQEPAPRRLPAKKPEWMKDFEPDSEETRAGASNQPNPPVQPDWMKDFE